MGEVDVTGQKRPWQAKWAPAMFLGEGLVEYIGAGIAVTLFATAGSFSVAWGRIALSALILLLWRRPRPRGADGRTDWHFIRSASIFGIVLGGMNMVFYAALEHIPLGTAVSLEYLGPVVLAVVAGRGWRTWLGSVFALLGVFSISWAGVDLTEKSVQIGVGCALLSGVFWAGYIGLGRRGAAQGNGLNRLAIGMAAATIVYAPIGIPGFAPLATDAKAAGTLVLVALMSSVIPFAIEQVILAGVSASMFSLLAALLPATSMLAGLITLGQVPNVGQLAGLTCISVAVALASLPSSLRRKGERRRRRGRASSGGEEL